MKQALLLFVALLMAFAASAKTNNSPYGFIENKGQIIDQNNNLNPSVKYLWTGNGMKVQLKGNSFSYEVMKTEKFKSSNPQASTTLSHRGLEMSKHGKAAMDDSTVIYSHRIDIALIGANPNPELKAEGQSEDYLNYYTTGTPEAGVTYVHQYQEVTYQNIYPNIDLEFVLDAANQQPFKYNFIVHPGGKVSDIQLQYKGANSTNLTQSGSLNIATAYGNVEESIPSSYIAETGKDIIVYYQQNNEGVYGFSAGNYNAQQTLVIDPWATYYGGGLGQIGIWGNITDGNNDIVLLGETNSTTNIASIGAYQSIYGGGQLDCFLVKFAQLGSRIWSTYYGGTGPDKGIGICADKNNNIIITGEGGPDHIATSGTFIDSLLSGGAFFSKFNSNGILIWGSYYYETCWGVTTDNLNNILLTGHNDSTLQSALLVTSGAYQTVNAGKKDCFVSKFSPNCVRLWSTFYGGENYDWAWGVCCDTFNNVIITGQTMSTTGIATSGAFLTTKPSNDGAFIAKFNDTGNLVWGTYYGGGQDIGRCITTDLNGNIFVGGETWASTGIATPGAYQSIPNGNNDFVVKFTPTGTREWGTYYGGNSTIIDQYCFDITCDKSGNVYIAGVTGATSNIATVGAYRSNYGGGDGDAYLAKFSNNGTMKWATYFGDKGDEDAYGVAIDNSYNVVLCGSTTSDSNISTPGAYQTILNGGLDAYIASFDSTGHIPPTGINDLNQQTESFIKVYPNPAKDKITVIIKEYAGSEGTILLTTIDGKVVKSVVIKSQENSIDMKELPAGVYLIEYNNGEVCETLKVIRE